MSVRTFNFESHFLLRTNMYVRKPCCETISAYVYGYEHGKNSKWNLISQIAEYLESTYQITGSSLGWPGAIEQYSNMENISWYSAFKRLGLMTIIEQDTIEDSNDLYSFIRETMVKAVESLNDEGKLNNNYLTDWDALSDTSSNW